MPTHSRCAHESPRHLCGWPACNKTVPTEMWGCTYHWFQVPIPLRNALVSTYSVGQTIQTLSPDYIKANQNIRNWIALNYPAQSSVINNHSDIPNRP